MVCSMMILTTDNYPGKEVEPLGMVRGGNIQTVNMFKDIGSALKTLIGGELKNYNGMMDTSRKVAMERMIAEANALGADAIVGVRMSSAAIMQGAAEIMFYGTAVKFKENE